MAAAGLLLLSLLGSGIRGVAARQVETARDGRPPPARPWTPAVPAAERPAQITGMPVGPAAPAGAGAPPVRTPAALSLCRGPHDLLVASGTVTLAANHTFDHLCVEDYATLAIAANLTLRVGTLFVALHGTISADGADGAAACAAMGDDPSHDGAAGANLTILAYTVTILGNISSNGGAAGGTDRNTCPKDFVGAGGAGGNLTIEALTLTVRGTLSARTGGVEGRPSGTVMLLSAQANPAPGARIFAGKTIAGRLAPTQAAALPPAPAEPVLVRQLGAGPTFAPLASPAAFARGMLCGRGDLRLAGTATLTLAGDHTYAHVCLEDRATLRVPSTLTLRAQTISIAPGATIDASGVVTEPASGQARDATGQYATSLAGFLARPNRAVPPAGTPGAEGGPTGPCSGACTGALGGAGGGTVVLVARRLLVAGAILAEGGAGDAGEDGSTGLSADNATECTAAGNGGGGGSGGGILVAAQEAQISGLLSVWGGDGGPGGSPCPENTSGGDGSAGALGADGMVKLFAGTLRVAAGGVPIAGQGVVGHLLPTDPAPPPAVASPVYLYVTATSHSLSGAFLAFYQRYGGLDTFGYSRTEPFAENGMLLQYTDRFLLEARTGAVRIAPLGRLLTAGRHVPRVSPVPSSATRLYFSRTGHTLSGRFLTYWQAHHGALLLGLPITEPAYEQNGDGSGATYLVQWFENGRLEYHPALPARYRVEIGLLGKQDLRRRGWL